MRSRKGHSHKEQRVTHVVAGLRSRNFSVCSIISKNGCLHKKVQSTPFNRITFIVFINEVIQILSIQSICDVIFVMDNVRFHKLPKISNLIIMAGHRTVFLPIFSPFLNPIENMLSQWKQIVRQSRPTDEQRTLKI